MGGRHVNLLAGNIIIIDNWMWVKMEDLGDHRCWSSLVITIHNFGVPNFDPYPTGLTNILPLLIMTIDNLL